MKFSNLLPAGLAAKVERIYGDFYVTTWNNDRGTNQMRIFEHAQDAADWIEANMPGVPVRWEVKP